MDDARDIKKTDQLARFLDEQSIRIKPFGRNISGEKAYARAERIVAALYLITAHIAPEEPARIRIREIGLKLLENLLSLRDEMRASSSQTAGTITSHLRELVSITRLLTVSGFISTQNAEAVTIALDELANFLASAQKSPLSESITFSKEDFMSGNLPPLSKSLVRPRAPVLRTETDTLKDGSLDKDVTDSRLVQDVAFVIGDRSQAILDILRVGGEMGIRLIAGHLPEYSEKMIQRELVELIKSGKVKKNGFKRWSRYSLA
ncbi:MAG TPA: hypothetical protein VJH69_02845 [Candidatus Paceibacterota bacterium]